MEKQPATLQDILNYDADTYFSPEELALVKRTVSPEFLSVLRKVLIPSIQDPQLPLEEFGKDVWMQSVDWQSMSINEIKPLVVGRQLALKFIVGGLIQLKFMANDGKESPAEKILREKKNSTK